MANGPLVLRRFLKDFYNIMGMAAFLIMWPRCGKKTFIPPAHEGSIWNLALIGPVVLRRCLKSVDDGRRMEDGQTDGRMAEPA